jgi:2Fe-2S iron-sulfur cluster binding domain
VRIVNRAAAQGPAPTVTILVNGQPVPAVLGSSLSAALWNTGWRAFSAHPVNGRPRGPLCGMGVCQECLLWLADASEATEPGEPSGVAETAGVGEMLSPGRARLVRSCLEPVRAGLRVRLDPPAAGGETSA